MGKKMRDRPPTMRYFSRTQFARREDHVKERRHGAGQQHAALLLTVWSLTDVSYLPERLHLFLHYLNHEPASSGAFEYGRQCYLYRTRLSGDEDRRLLSHGQVALERRSELEALIDARA
jgi:hypothetical protein